MGEMLPRKSFNMHQVRSPGGVSHIANISAPYFDARHPRHNEQLTTPILRCLAEAPNISKERVDMYDESLVAESRLNTGASEDVEALHHPAEHIPSDKMNFSQRSLPASPKRRNPISYYRLLTGRSA